jgi:hypothetical protein
MNRSELKFRRLLGIALVITPFWVLSTVGSALAHCTLQHSHHCVGDVAATTKEVAGEVTATTKEVVGAVVAATKEVVGEVVAITKEITKEVMKEIVDEIVRGCFNNLDKCLKDDPKDDPEKEGPEPGSIAYCIDNTDDPKCQIIDNSCETDPNGPDCIHKVALTLRGISWDVLETEIEEDKLYSYTVDVIEGKSLADVRFDIAYSDETHDKLQALYQEIWGRSIRYEEYVTHVNRLAHGWSFGDVRAEVNAKFQSTMAAVLIFTIVQ